MKSNETYEAVHTIRAPANYQWSTTRFSARTSHLSYGISVWGSSASKSKLNNLFMLQKKAIRNLFGIKKESKNVKGHTKQTFNDNKILTVHNLASYFTVTFISKVRLQKTPTYLYELLSIDNTIPRILFAKFFSLPKQLSFLWPKNLESNSAIY